MKKIYGQLKEIGKKVCSNFVSKSIESVVTGMV